jgi:hypothetical protein
MDRLPLTMLGQCYTTPDLLCGKFGAPDRSKCFRAVDKCEPSMQSSQRQMEQSAILCKDGRKDSFRQSAAG